MFYKVLKYLMFCLVPVYLCYYGGGVRHGTRYGNKEETPLEGFLKTIMFWRQQLKTHYGTFKEKEKTTKKFFFGFTVL